MGESANISTAQAIGFVYEELGRPDKKILKPTTVCTKYWNELDTVLEIVDISDRTIFLKWTPDIPAGQGLSEVPVAEPPDFGAPLAFARVDRSTSIERLVDMPLVGDVRELSSVVELAACLFRDPDAATLTLRFNRPLVDAETFRMAYEPFGLGMNPGLDDKSPIVQAVRLAILKTAFACIPDVAKIYPPGVVSSYSQTLGARIAEKQRLFEIWAMKDKGTGVKHRKAFNEGRRGGRRYGGRPTWRG
jgi:hypothetical protein